MHHDPGRALLTSLPLLVTTIAVLMASQSQLRTLALDLNWHRAVPALSPPWPDTFQILLGIAMGIALLGLIVPLVSLGEQIRGLSALATSVAEAHGEIKISLVIAGAAALLSLPLAYTAAQGALTKGPWGRVWWLAITVPMAMPGPLVGIGLITLWHRTGNGIYGSLWMPIFAAMARYAPLGALILIATLRRRNPRLIEAAALLETHPVRTWGLVRLPLLGPGLLASAGLVFCLSLGELSATLLVSPPGQPTLTMRIYNYLHYGASETVAGLTLVMIMLVLVFGSIVAAALALWERITAMRPDRQETK